MKVKATELYQIAAKQSKEDARATLFTSFQESLMAATTAIVKANMEFSSLAASVRLATYSSGEYDQAIVRTTKANVAFAATNEQSAKAITSLGENFSEFASLSETAKQEMEDLTVQMGKAGISADSLTRGASLLSKGLGMGVSQIKKFNQELILFAKSNHISNKVIAEGYDQVLPKMMALGEKGPKIFEKLAYQANQTGLSMSKLLSITEQMTTYEGAAEFAGKLNALFGKQLFDTMETLRLSTEDPAKMIETIRNRLQSVGKTFNQMSPSFKRALAHDMHIPLEELTNMMGKNSAELKEEQANQEKFNEAVQKFVPVGEKLKALFVAFTPVFTDIISKFESAITWLTEFAQEWKGLINFVGVAIAVLGTVITVVQGIGFAVNVVSSTIGLLTSMFGLKTAATIADTAATGANTVAKGASAAADAAAAAAKITDTAVTGANTVAKGLNTAADAAATGMKVSDTAATVANSVAKEVNAVASGTMATATVASNAAVGASAPLLAGAIIPMLAFGAALLMAGIGALGMGAGIYLAVTSTTALISVLVAAKDTALVAGLSFLLIAGGIYVLAQALMVLGITGSAGAAILGVLALAALAFGVAYKIIGDSMQSSVQAVKDLAEMDMSKIEKLRDIFGIMADHMSRVASSVAILSTFMLNPILGPAIALAMATPLVMAAAPATIKSDANDVSSLSPESTTKDKEITINVKIDSPVMLDKDKIGKFVLEEIQKYNISKNKLHRIIANPASNPTPKNP
jgi:hypothetical protein